MSYGQCAKCPAAVAAWQLTAAAVAAVPEASLLCAEHLGLLMRLRQDAARRGARQALRRWCVGLPWDSCGRELYLPHPHCSWCLLGQPRSVSVPCGDISLKVDPEWYTRSPCDEPDCSAVKVYRMPDGRVVCDKHGAGSSGDDKIYS